MMSGFEITRTILTSSQTASVQCISIVLQSQGAGGEGGATLYMLSCIWGSCLRLCGNGCTVRPRCATFGAITQLSTPNWTLTERYYWHPKNNQERSFT